MAKVNVRNKGLFLGKEGDISYIDDILDEMLHFREYVLTRKEIKQAVEIYFEFIAKETANKDVHSMHLPFIGTLCRNMYFMKNARWTYPKDDPKRELLAEQYKELEYFKDEICPTTPHKRVPLSFSYYKEIKDEWEVERPYKKDRQSLEILAVAEEIQNNTNNKK